jgi:hypothetical protein
MHPGVFVDPGRARLYYYCANPTFLQTDPEIDGSRAAFVHDLRKLLAPIIGTPDAMQRTFDGIEART